MGTNVDHSIGFGGFNLSAVGRGSSNYPSIEFFIFLRRCSFTTFHGAMWLKSSNALLWAGSGLQLQPLSRTFH